MEAEQKRLYLHFKNLSKNGENDKQRTECGKYAKEILDSFPHFEKVEKEEVKKDSKEVKEKK